MNKKSTYRCVVTIILLLFVGITTISASTIMNENNNRTTANTKETVFRAKELYDAFKKNKEEATRKYNKKIISIKGYAVYVGPDAYALPSVELSEVKKGKSRILCVLPFSDYLQLRKVSKGDEVICKGEVRALYEEGDMVLMKNCKIESVNK